MTITLPRLPASVEQPSNLRFVRFVRFALPLFLFALASSFESWEHWVEGEVSAV